MRVQIPAKAKFAPTFVRNSLLSELRMYYLFIMRQVIYWFVYIGNWFVISVKAFARDYGITGVRLSVCLFVTTITK